MERSREQGEGGMNEKQEKGRMKEKKRREKRSEGMNGRGRVVGLILCRA